MAFGFRPDTGTLVSGAAHAGIILYLIVGGFFVSRNDMMDVSVSQVSLISGEELAAMQAQAPRADGAPVAPKPPAVLDALPSMPKLSESAAVETQQPPPPDDPAPAPAPKPDPKPAPEPQPAPEPEDVPAETEVAKQDVPGDPGAQEVDPDAQPTPPPADQIADEVIPEPDPDVETGETDQEATEVSQDAEAVVESEQQDASAREAATTDIVTEADEPSTAAPTRSRRPGVKPTPPPPTAVAEEQQEEPDEEAPSLSGSIDDALAQANEETSDDAAESGSEEADSAETDEVSDQAAQEDNANPGGGTSSPITREEKGAFILGIRKCWNVGALGTDALRVTVVVSFQMNPDSTPNVGTIKLVSAVGGAGAAVDRAFEAARRAIIRCGAKGYGLPQDKYDQWREVEVKFNASNKQIR